MKKFSIEGCMTTSIICNNILSSSHFGYRSAVSNEHALLEFTDDILMRFDNKIVAIAPFMDSSKGS